MLLSSGLVPGGLRRSAESGDALFVPQRFDRIHLGGSHRRV